MHVPAADRYERMTYNRCGRSGLQLPAVSLGLWHNFGHDRPLDTIRAISWRAFASRRSAPRARGPGSGPLAQLGAMFWLIRKKLSGSYFCFSARSRSYFSGP